MASHRIGRPHADPGADGLRQDPGRLPVGHGPPGRRTDPAPGRAVQGPVRLAAPGPGGGRGEEPPLSPGRHPAGRRAPGRRAARADRGHANGRHAGERAARHPQASPRHPHHHSRIAVPHAHLAGPGDPAERPVGHRRRGPLGGGDQAGRAPRALARATRGHHPNLTAADRPVGHPAPAGGDRPVPGRADRRRPPSGDDRGRRPPKAHGGRGGRPRRGHGRTRAGPRARRAGSCSRRPGPPEHLAIGPPPPARADPRAPVNADLRERPPPGRTPGGPAERAGRRGPRSSPSRFDRAGAAPGDRGSPEARNASGAGGHELAGARDRHGGHRPGGAGGVAGLGGPRAPADRPGRPQRGRAQQRQAVPQVPGRPPGGGRGRPADAGRPDRGDPVSAQSPRRPGPADRGHVRGRRVDRAGSRRLGSSCGELRRSVRRAAVRRPRPAVGQVPLGRLLGAPAPDRVGPSPEHASSQGRGGAARRDERGDHPRPRPVRRVPPRRDAGRRARRGDGVRKPAR